VIVKRERGIGKRGVVNMPPFGPILQLSMQRNFNATALEICFYVRL
jgi:hypothetical protein